MTKIIFTVSIWYMVFAVVFVSFGIHLDLQGRYVQTVDPVTGVIDAHYEGGLIDALYNANYQLISPADFKSVFSWSELEWDGVLEPLGNFLNSLANAFVSVMWIGAQIINVVTWFAKSFAIAFVNR